MAWNIHVLDVTFLWCFCSFVFFMILKIMKSTKLNADIKDMCFYGRYGKVRDSFSVPKQWFSHFYIFAALMSLWSLYWVLKLAIFRQELPNYLENLLNTLGGGRNRQTLIDTTTAVIAMCLMCLQCVRRCYETHFVQIFSKKLKMSWVVYLSSFVYYFCLITTLMINAEGTVRGSLPSPFSFANITFYQYLAMFVFLFSSWQQNLCHRALANLRRDPKSGAIVTEKHIMPTGGLFEWITSPHMLFEILIYMSLLVLMSASKTWWLVTALVITNQTYFAICAHQWCKAHFEGYPKRRKALIPLVL